MSNTRKWIFCLSDASAWEKMETLWSRILMFLLLIIRKNGEYGFWRSIYVINLFINKIYWWNAYQLLICWCVITCSCLVILRGWLEKWMSGISNQFHSRASQLYLSSTFVAADEKKISPKLRFADKPIGMKESETHNLSPNSFHFGWQQRRRWNIFYRTQKSIYVTISLHDWLKTSNWLLIFLSHSGFLIQCSRQSFDTWA